MDDEEHTADVIHLFTREPWTPDLPIERINETDEAGMPAIDDDSIKMLEYMLEDLKSGKYAGVVAMVWDREQQDFKNLVSLPPRVNPAQAAFMFSGGLDLLKVDLQELATFGAFGGEKPSKQIIMMEMGEDPDSAS